MKILFASDIHINEHKVEQKILEDTKAGLDFICKTARDLQPMYLVLLGDIFDKRTPTPIELQVFNRWLLEAREHVEAEILILEGNHDVDRNISTLSYLRDLKIRKVGVVRPPYTLADYYFGHEHVSGAVADNGFVLSGGSSLDAIIKSHPECKVFAFGDFHRPQVLRNKPFCFYAGSLIKTNFAQRDDKKILWLFENAKLVKTIPIPTRPMYQFDIEVKEGKDWVAPWTDKGLAGSLVKIVVSGTKQALLQVNELALRKLLLESNYYAAKEVRIVYNVTGKSKPRNKQINESVTESEALKEYFKGKKVENKEEIVKRGLKIIKELKGV